MNDLGILMNFKKTFYFQGNVRLTRWCRAARGEPACSSPTSSPGPSAEPGARRCRSSSRSRSRSSSLGRAGCPRVAACPRGGRLSPRVLRVIQWNAPCAKAPGPRVGADLPGPEGLAVWTRLSGALPWTPCLQGSSPLVRRAFPGLLQRGSQADGGTIRNQSPSCPSAATAASPFTSSWALRPGSWQALTSPGPPPPPPECGRGSSHMEGASAWVPGTMPARHMPSLLLILQFWRRAPL